MLFRGKENVSMFSRQFRGFFFKCPACRRVGFAPCSLPLKSRCSVETRCLLALSLDTQCDVAIPREYCSPTYHPESRDIEYKSRSDYDRLTRFHGRYLLLCASLTMALASMSETRSSGNQIHSIRKPTDFSSVRELTLSLLSKTTETSGGDLLMPASPVQPSLSGEGFNKTQRSIGTAKQSRSSVFRCYTISRSLDVQKCKLHGFELTHLEPKEGAETRQLALDYVDGRSGSFIAHDRCGGRWNGLDSIRREFGQITHRKNHITLLRFLANRDTQLFDHCSDAHNHDRGLPLRSCSLHRSCLTERIIGQAGSKSVHG